MWKLVCRLGATGYDLFVHLQIQYILEQNGLLLSLFIKWIFSAVCMSI